MYMKQIKAQKHENGKVDVGYIVDNLDCQGEE